MPSVEWTLLADSLGVPINPPVEGIEVENLASRRIIDFNGVSFSRLQFGSTTTNIKCELQYSMDEGLTWAILIPQFDRDVPSKHNEISDWITLPDEVLFKDVMVRAMLYGSGQLTRITYLSLQVR